MGKSPLKPVEPPQKDAENAPLIKRLGWLVMIMAIGVTTIGAVAYGLRKLLFLGI